MANDFNKSDVSKFKTLINILDEELDELSEDDLLKRAEEEFGSIDAMTGHFNSILNNALQISKRRKYESAKEGYKKALENENKKVNSNNVFSWPIERKKALLLEISTRDNALTMAARNDSDSEADIDSILQDLIDLDAIDEKGNIE